jgi:hypothetical protein
MWRPKVPVMALELVAGTPIHRLEIYRSWTQQYEQFVGVYGTGIGGGNSNSPVGNIYGFEFNSARNSRGIIMTLELVAGTPIRRLEI